MKEEQKQSWASYNKSDYINANKAWQNLVRKNPDQKEGLKNAQRLAQLKLVFGKNMLKTEQYKQVNEFLGMLDFVAEDFGQYWGY